MGSRKLKPTPIPREPERAHPNPVMGPITLSRLHGLFKKELALQNSTGFTLINRLLLGPLISLATTAILYSSFFGAHPETQLGGLDGTNYLTYLAFGFLLHTYLNAGYYCFSAKVVGEAMTGTLKLLWIAPCNRWVSLFSLSGMEVLRCAVVLAIAMALAAAPGAPWAQATAFQLVGFAIFLPLCLFLGIARAMVTLTNGDVADLIDHAYLFVVLTACPYIPQGLLPKALQPLCFFNPAFHMGHLMRGGWSGALDLRAHGLPLLGLTAVLSVAGLLLWRRLRNPFLRRCFA